MTKALQPGSVFAGRYEVLRLIGTGGMGAVYEVLQRETRRKRALKVLLPVLVSDPEARARFAQEACITAEIESEYLIDVFDAGIDEGTGCPFIVLELLKGQSLGEALAAGRRFSAQEVVDILRQTARALAKTHAAGIVHRDLKPDNLFLTTREDGSPRTKILDFGIAKVAAQAGKARNTVNIGTPLYMAPEQLDGSTLDGRADLYALGHIAFELLTGESYWENEVRTAPSTMALLRWIERGLPEAPRVRAKRLGVQVGPDFDRWFVRATATSPADRYGSASELAEGFAFALGLQAAEISSISRPGGLKVLAKTQPVKQGPSPDPAGRPLTPSPTLEMVLPLGPDPAAARPEPAQRPVPLLITSSEQTTDRTTLRAPADGRAIEPRPIAAVRTGAAPPDDLHVAGAEPPLSGVTGPRFTRSGTAGGKGSALIWVAVAGGIGVLGVGAIVLGLGGFEQGPSEAPRTVGDADEPAPPLVVVSPAPSEDLGPDGRGAENSGRAAGSVSAVQTASAALSTKRVTPRPVNSASAARAALCRREPHRCR